jgi:putative DNA-invertase from lambdoid prophage Rac
VSLDQGAIDLNSATGTLIVNVLLSVAQMERDLIIERTNAGLARAKANGIKLGRTAGSKYTSEVQELKNQGLTQKQIEVRLGISRSTVKRNWSK